MKKSIIKIAINLLLLEIIFLLLSKIVFLLIPHQVVGWIYYVNINLYFLISCYIWITLKLSDLNKSITILLGFLFSLITMFSIFGLFIINFEHTFRYIYNFVMHISIALLYLLTTLYIFFISVLNNKTTINNFVKAVIFTLIIGVINYFPLLINGNYINAYERLFKFNYYIYILNFSFLVVFWQQYTHNKIIFSEFLSNILLIFTISIALKILHMFSYQNNLIFYFFSQYFNAFLNLIMFFLWLARLNYLYLPESKYNEKYIANYSILHGFIDKPRKGIILALYSNLNKTTKYVFLFIMLSLGFGMFTFNHFQIFIKLNILILILSLIISTIIAIIYWQKRWHETIGFFFIKRNR